MIQSKTRLIMTERKRRIAEIDAKMIEFYRKNPCIACEDLLGIKLLDSQKYILQSAWNAGHSVWCCSRNFGKSFLGSIFIILKAILYENQSIYIISSVGGQAKETFSKIEEIILNTGKTANSIKSLKPIVKNEIVVKPPSQTGFSHLSSGYSVEFFNGSQICTLNSKPDNTRSRRATLVFFDEAAFCNDELIAVCEAFATQNTDFKTSTQDTYSPKIEKRQCPTQLVYASSQNDTTTIFYKHYKEFAKRMIAGDRNYFCCDMDCTTAIEVYIEGQKWTPLLTMDKVEAALKVNRIKALREYYNQPIVDGGVNQIIKMGTVVRNSIFEFPVLFREGKHMYVLAFDPARTIDNSVVTVMEICFDDEIGYYGRIVNCVNLVDIGNKHGYKLDSNKQIEIIRQMLVDYNGNAPDYEFVYKLLIDSGAGGGGQQYGDRLLRDWEDKSGKKHKGLIDRDYKLYENYDGLYPNALDKVELIDPRAMKRIMVEETLEMLSMDLIKFPKEYSGNGSIRIYENDENKENEEIYKDISLTDEQENALLNIDALKSEITSIHRFTNNSSKNVIYALPKDKENKMHDDRFYTFIMLGHFLYHLRRKSDYELAGGTSVNNYVPLCN